MERITSRTNPGIKAAAALLQSGARKESGMFLAEGARLCADAAANGVELETCYFTAEAMEKYPAQTALLQKKSARCFEIAESVADKLADTARPQGIFAVCRKPLRSLSIRPDGFYVLTDGVQNPDNLGAIARTAEAFGADGLLIAGGCDPYGPKALRASMGALLRFPVCGVENAAGEARALREAGLRVWAAALTSEAQDLRTVEKTGGAVCVIGNEGNGVSPETLAACSGSVIIPMAGLAESLNAAAAAAVLLWEFTKNRTPAAEKNKENKEAR